MLNRRLSYLRSSGTWPIYLCAAEKIHEVRRPCARGLNDELMTYLIHRRSAINMKAYQLVVNL